MGQWSGDKYFKDPPPRPAPLPQRRGQFAGGGSINPPLDDDELEVAQRQARLLADAGLLPDIDPNDARAVTAWWNEEKRSQRVQAGWADHAVWPGGIRSR